MEVLEAEESDAELVARIARGDREAFRAAYARYHARLYAFLLRMVLDRAVAEDLLQETWVRFARSHRELREGSRLGGWLFRIARNLATSRARHATVERAVIDARADGDATDAGPSPHTALESARLRDRLEQALAALSLEDRELLLLVGVEAMRPQEVAVVLGVRSDVVRKRLERARERLRGLLGDDAPWQTGGEP